MSSPVEKDLTVRVQLQKGLQKYLTAPILRKLLSIAPASSGLKRLQDGVVMKTKISHTITLPSSETSALFTEEKIKRSIPPIRCFP